jgi:enoyl-CoA hydratase/carnithine racemase
VAAAETLVAEFLTRSPDALAAGKFLLQRGWNAPEGDVLAQERQWQRRLMAHVNQRIAVQNNMSGKDGKTKPYRRRNVNRP